MKKIAVVVDCPIDTTINVLKGKCKAGIISKIHEGVHQFTALSKEISISTRLLALQLGELEEDGIITKEVPKGNHLLTSYSLTPDGAGLCQVIEGMRRWGTSYKHFVLSRL